LRVAGLKTLAVGCIGDYCWVSVRRVTKRGRRREGVTLTHGLDPGRIDVVTLGVEEALEESLKVPADGPPDRVNGDPLTNGLSLEISQVDVLEAANFQSEHSRNKEKKKKKKKEEKKRTHHELAIINLHGRVIHTTTAPLGSSLLILLEIYQLN